jgi:phage terminase large subunit GpA-like protein
MPYKDEGYKPDLKKILKHTGTYKKGTVPDNVIFLTMAADVQRGREKYQRMSPEELDRVTENLIREKGATNVWKSEKLPRIEFEVMGVGKNLHSWMVDYQVVYGHTTLGGHEGAFKKLRKMIENGEFFYNKNDGTKHGPKIVFIDASDGMTRQAVFDFCARDNGVFPVVNYAAMKLKKQKNIEEASPFDLDRYRFKNKSKEGGSYYQLSVNHYKKKLYEYLNTPRQQSENQAPTFCDFPIDAHEHYFKMLASEERLEDGSFYNSGVAAESLDCRAYNFAAEDIYLEEIFIPKLKKKLSLMKGKNGHSKYTKEDIDAKIDKKFALNEMINPGVY